MGDSNTWALLIIAALNALTAWFTYKTRKDMKTLEINTNSIKDALVASTAKESHASGLAEGRAEERK